MGGWSDESGGAEEGDQSPPSLRIVFALMKASRASFISAGQKMSGGSLRLTKAGVNSVWSLWPCVKKICLGRRLLTHRPASSSRLSCGMTNDVCHAARERPVSVRC